jgi:broad specificity phosphatase PhoE
LGGKTKKSLLPKIHLSWDAWMHDPAVTKPAEPVKPGGSIERVNAFLTEMLQKHANETIVVVGHNGINRLYMAYKLGMELKTTAEYSRKTQPLLF